MPSKDDLTVLPVRLMHIPKTAGTTLASALLRRFGRRHVCNLTSAANEDRERLLALSPEERAPIRIFIGHSVYQTGIPEADAATIVTYLREPVSRVRSFIAYVAAGRTGHWQAGSGAEAPFSVDEFLEQGAEELKNLQVKSFINEDRLDSKAGLEQLGEDRALELATERLFNGVRAFGLQDRFDEGWAAIWTSLRARPPVYPSVNRGRNRATFNFTPAQISKIEALNALDLEFYRRAREEFDRRLRENPALMAEVEDLRRRQARYGKLYTLGWTKSRKLYWTIRKRLRGGRN